MVNTVRVVTPETLAAVPDAGADRSSLVRRLADFYEVPGGHCRIEALQGIRGLAILLVFFVHYHTLFGSYVIADAISHSVSRFAGIVGHSGVDLFFVLSGFLIYGMVLRTRMP